MPTWDFSPKLRHCAASWPLLTALVPTLFPKCSLPGSTPPTTPSTHTHTHKHGMHTTNKRSTLKSSSTTPVAATSLALSTRDSVMSITLPFPELLHTHISGKRGREAAGQLGRQQPLGT